MTKFETPKDAEKILKKFYGKGNLFIFENDIVEINENGEEITIGFEFQLVHPDEYENNLRIEIIKDEDGDILIREVE